MAITFNNIPTTVRTPGAYGEIDNSRALQGLTANPHKALIIGDKLSTGSKAYYTLEAISRDNLADGYYGTGSLLARMINKFKENNPNTELYAIATSCGTAQASARVNFSQALSGTAQISGQETLKLLINGVTVERTMTSGWSETDICSDLKTYISETGDFPVTVSHDDTGLAGTSTVLVLSAVNSGVQGNYLDVRFNYYDGDSFPTCFTDSVEVSNFEGGAGTADLDDVWAVAENEQFQHIIQPWIDATNLTSLETELEDRFKPLEDLAGHGYTCVRGAQASCTTLGNSRNSPHNTILGVYDSPTDPAEWAAALGAIAATNLNQDPARPLQGLKLSGVLAPPRASRFTRSERDILLYDGIATFTVDTGGNPLIERCITTYQTNPQGIADPSYLDIQTLFTLIEIRRQYKSRMTDRFIVPRFKLADDGFPVQPGSKVVTPSMVKQETISLFTRLRDIGLIENLDDFVENLVVEKNTSDLNRVDVLLPPDLIGQFRVLAAQIQFIL